MAILTLNAGSSSLKFALFDVPAGRADSWEPGDPVRSGTIDLEREALDFGAAALRAVSDARSASAGGMSLEAVGHRVVHGGTRFVSPVAIDETVEAEIEKLSELAPLHNPSALAVIRSARRALPHVPHVAVFDTAFFANLPEAARVYPVPWQWTAEWGIRRFGFHGLSHEHANAAAAHWRGGSSEAGLRVVSCHLGQGCSAAAAEGGKPVATTMGFTPLEGLMMGSRSGSIDPGILTWVLSRTGWTPGRLEEALSKSSGLLGVSGISSDFRRVEAAAAAGNSRAHLALEIYADRVRAAVGALSASLGGLDMLVFTGGVGEHSPSMRAAICWKLGYLGIALDAERNSVSSESDREVSKPGSHVRVLVVRAGEEAVIARKTRSIIASREE